MGFTMRTDSPPDAPYEKLASHLRHKSYSQETTGDGKATRRQTIMAEEVRIMASNGFPRFLRCFTF